MSFKIIPLDMISAPNYYAPKADKMWTITDPNQQTLWMGLSISDSLGDRLYVPVVGATLSLVFQRSDLISVNTQGNLVNTVQSVTKSASANTTNRALWSVVLTQQDVRTLTSGTVKFTLIESGTTTTWVQNWILKKTLTDPGY